MLLVSKWRNVLYTQILTKMIIVIALIIDGESIK